MLLRNATEAIVAEQSGHRRTNKREIGEWDRAKSFEFQF